LSLYPPPRELTTRVFAELPREFRTHYGKSEWGAANKPGQRVDSFLEGPSFDRAGYLYVTDIPYGRIFRISPAGQWELVVQYDGWPNGLKIHRDGRIFIADYRRGILVLVALTWATSAFSATQFVTQIIQSTGNVGPFASLVLARRRDRSQNCA